MKLITLGSGSKGNSTYIETQNTKILIDSGLSFRETCKRLCSIGVSANDIDAIFVTHEHGDHINGIPVFLKNCSNTKVYVHEPIISIIREKCKNINPLRIVPFDKEIILKDLTIKAFSVSHDSFDCVGYQVFDGKKYVGFATDLGYFNQEIINFLVPCSLVVLEANHDVQKLIKNPHYPIQTKARILSGKGHLSNDQSAELIYILAQNKVKQIILAHLSEENNTPILAFNTICEYLKTKNIIEGVDIFIDVSTQKDVGNFF
ncbi:MAG: MBL fold metallo-hydrolase [Clostridia bacterium]|nr:MBL fold metallo-hydrolase [Clostridia bacterium]